jgi:hypothetical protein
LESKSGLFSESVEEQLRLEIVYLEKLGEIDGLAQLKKALVELEKTERAEGKVLNTVFERAFEETPLPPRVTPDSSGPSRSVPGASSLDCTPIKKPSVRQACDGVEKRPFRVPADAIKIDIFSRF